MKKEAAVLLAALAAASAVFSGGIQNTAVYAEEKTSTMEEVLYVSETTKAENGQDQEAALASSLQTPHALVMEVSTGKVLFEKNADEKLHPASVTKIMTVLLIFEALDQGKLSLEQEVATSAHAKSMGGSQVFLEEGEVQTVDTLLKCIIIASGNDASVAMAEQIAGSEEAFVAMMNERAAQLGMKNTHFVNTTGLHDREHYSTVEDISVLLQYALKNESFREALSSRWHSVQASAQHPEGFTFYSTMFQHMDSASVTGGEILGGKTGYTKEAGLCLASLAQIHGKEYILVTAKADGSHETEPYHILDAVNVYKRVGEKMEV